MRAREILVLGMLCSLVATATAVETLRPLREAKSENGRFTLRVEAGRAGRGGRSCQAMLVEQAEPNARERERWKRALVNDVAPAYACVRDDGRFLVTLDEYRRGGARHALVIYGADGELLRHFRLTDLLPKSAWKKVDVDRRNLDWLGKPELRFEDKAGQFVVRCESGLEVRIDLRTLEVVRAGKQRDAALSGVPADVLAVLLSHDTGDNDRVIGERIAQLSQLSPQEQAQADAIGEQLAATSRPSDPNGVPTSAPAVHVGKTAKNGKPGQAGDETSASATTQPTAREARTTAEREAAASAAASDVPVAADPVPELPAKAGMTPGETSDAPQPNEQAAAPPATVPMPPSASAPGGQPGEMPAEGAVDDGVLPADAAALANELEQAAQSPNMPIAVPQPDPRHAVDYVGWLNGMGQVDGPDAAPVYAEASAQFVRWAGNEDLMRAAERGDPAALASPEIAAWLDQNAQALETFRAATLMPALGWNRTSNDGTLIGVLLPELAGYRQMSKAAVLDGRHLALEGQPEAAAGRYLDAMAAASHVGNGMTLIENLVGVAIEANAAEALLDLQADATAGEVDYVALAQETQAACRPLRSAAETIQGERAMYLDAAQQLWEYSPQAGQVVFNEAKAAEFLGMVSPSPEQSTIGEDALAALKSEGFERTVAVGNAYYDAMTAAMSLPYTQAVQPLQQLEELMTSESSNPFLRMLTPSLTRYQMIRTRGEAYRRATTLVTTLNAYRQVNGQYPESLTELGGQEYVVDPFTGGQFVYRRSGNDFVLYSVGANGTDDAGVHDRKAETNDLVFWPRPPKAQ